MRILLITEFFTSLQNPQFSGGVETRTFYTAKYLSLNNQITVFARKRIGEKNYERYKNIEIYRFGKHIISSAATLSSICPRMQFIINCIKESKNLNIDLIEGSNFISYIPTIFISNFKKIPKIAWYPDTLKGKWIKEFGPILGSIGEICESIFLKIKWNQIITISNTVKKRLEKITLNNIKIIYCGTDFNKTKRIEKKDKIIVVSRLVKYKRVDWVIKLYTKLKNQFPKLTLTIIGSGPEEKNLKNLCKKLELENKINFLKNISNTKLEEEINNSKILIHPSLIEGFGIVLVESSKFGTPFVSANIPTAKELNQNLESGLLFDKLNFNDLITQTTILLKNLTLYQKLSQNGIKNSRKFNWQNLIKQTENIYKQTLNEK